MYLKSDRELYRHRKFPWRRLLLILAVLGIMVYGGYRIWSGIEQPLMVGSTPTPMPTATPAPSLYASQAEEAYWQGATAAAIDFYQKSLDMEPNQTHLYLELARLMIYQGKPERGVEMARQALIRQPENARAWALLGLAYDWLGLRQRAIQFCERAIELDPTLPEAYAYLAEAYIDNGQWMAANEAIETAMELDSTNVDVLRNYGYVLENQGNYSGAIQSYRDALEVHDQLVHLYLSIGRNALALQNTVLAREVYADAVEADPTDALALDRLGWVQLLMGDYDAALPNLKAAIEHDPTFADAHGHLGTLYYQQLNYEDAVEQFEPAIKYGEAESRRKTALFVVTAEPMNAIPDVPTGSEVAYAAFIHPAAFESPLRGEFQSQSADELQGWIRFDVMDGRYELSLTGMPGGPSGTVYIGWFLNLYWPEGNLVRTEPILPGLGGSVTMEGETGAVKGPPIENYYIPALSHYLLGDCDKGLPYLEIALRIDPQDSQALRTVELCQQQ